MIRETIIILLSLISFSGFGQETSTKLKAVPVVEQRSVYLNGGLRSEFGGKSRTTIEVDLPPNTKYWYYSFTTSEGESGTDNLNLLMQLSSLTADPSGLIARRLNEVKVPNGAQAIDVYLLDLYNDRPFETKADLTGGSYRSYKEGNVHNTRQGVVKIDDITQGRWYLGLKNPSSLDGININIEVVAVVEETVVIPKSREEEQSILYGSLGWQQFESGDYQKCLDQSMKSLELFPLGWVASNKALSLLMLGRESEAMDAYVYATLMVKGQSGADHYMKEMIKDIETYALPDSTISGAPDIHRFLVAQVKRMER